MDIVVNSLVKKFQADHDLKSLADDEAFEAFAGYCVLSSFYESGFNPDAFRMGGGNDLGIDVYGILINGLLLQDAADVRAVAEQASRLDVRIVLVQAKTSPKFEAKVLSDLADNLVHVVSIRDRLPYPASPDVENLRLCLDAVYANIAKLAGGRPQLHVAYVTTGNQVADLIRRKARSGEKRLMETGLFDVVGFSCVTRDDLRDLYRRATQAVSVVFEMPKKISLARMPGVEEALLGVLSARELVDKVLTDPTGHIRKALFHENVRDFQGYNPVNAQIRDTLREEGHQRFAVLNNGITIVTRNLRVVGDEVHVNDFQVVNGCQTCHVLFDERDGLTDDVQVSVRVVHSENEAVIAGIISATNRQTAVSEEDLSTREDFHLQLEEWFAAQDSGRHLLYERRSKQYVARPDVEKTRVVSRSQLTRAYAAMFLGEPSAVGHYRDLTKRRGNELFQDHQPFVTYYTAAAMHYRIEWLLRTRRLLPRLRPTRYHLMAALVWKTLGTASLANNPRKAAEQCKRLLDVIWEQGKAEQAVLRLVPEINKIIEVEEAAGVPLGEMVRNRRFADAVRAVVLPVG